MKRLNRLNDNARQQYTLVGDDGITPTLNLVYMPRVSMWSFSITYGDFQLNQAMLTASPNVLRNYRYNIPFGLAVTSTDGLDPFYLDDFTSGRINIYMLSAQEVQDVEDTIYS